MQHENAVIEVGGRQAVSKERLGAFLAKKRYERGISSYKLAKAIGAPSGPYITTIEKGRIDIRHGRKGYLEKIVRALGISSEELRTEFGVDFLLGDASTTSIKRSRDPLATTALSMGLVPVPVYQGPSDLNGPAKSINVIDPIKGVTMIHVVGLRLDNDEMAPYLEKGDTAIIDCSIHEPKPGDRIAVRLGDRVAIRNYLGRSPNGEVMHRLEAPSSPIEFSPADTEIVGTVVSRVKIR